MAMTKQEQFLYVVQTAILANGINIASKSAEDSDFVNRYRHEFSASGVIGLMQDVIRASELIPDELSSVEAADQFCSYMFDNLRHIEDEADQKPMTVPHWFARP